MGKEITLGELPIDIQKLAFQRAMEETNRETYVGARFGSQTKLIEAFDWEKSPEGFKYWSDLNYDKVTIPETKDTTGESTNQAVNESLTSNLEEAVWAGSSLVPKDLLVFNSNSITIPPKHKGLRFNAGKLRYDLVHPVAHEGMVRVLSKGAEKYAERNWEKGMAWSNVIQSLKRHLAAIEKGEDFDPETGELHINHVACNAHFLSAYYSDYPQGDDRPHKYLTEKRIGLDIDEVLCNWIGDWTTLRGMPHPNSWYFDRGLVEKFEEMKANGTLEEFYMNLEPLIKPEDIPFEPTCYITSRPVDSKVTEAWLAKHGFPAVPVHTTGVLGSKVDYALRENLDIFVDDGFHNFQALNKAGVCCFLMDAEHNKRYDVGYRRIKSLKDLKV